MAGVTLEQPAAAPGWIATTFEAFRIPTFRIIWLGTILAFLAFNISMTAQSVVAYDLTGSNRAVGTVLFGQGIAMLFLNPFGGAIADRFSKRMLMLVAQSVIGGVAFATAILIAMGAISILFLAAGAFVVGSMFAFLGPTRMALLGEYISQDRMGNAMALIQVGGNFSRIAGPFLAGAFLAWPLIGPQGTYFLITGIFVFVLATLSRIPPTPVHRSSQGTSVLQDVRLGFRHIVENPRLLNAVVSFHIVTMLGMAYIVLMPGFAKDVLDVGTSGLGVLLGVAAGGGLIASVIVAGIASSRRAPTYLRIVCFLFGGALIAVGLAPTFVTALAAMALVGAASGGFMALNNVIALSQTRPEFIGRVVGLIFLAWGMNSLFSLPVGFVADQIGERTVLAGLGAALCGVSLVLGLWGWRIDRGLTDGQPAGGIGQRARGIPFGAP